MPAYTLDRRVLGRLSANCSLERDLLAPLAQEGALRAVRQHGWFVDIGIPDDLARARRELAACMDRPALFLNVAGVLSQRASDGTFQDRWEWVDGARAAVAAATARGWHVFALTSQSGTEHGLYGRPDMATLHLWLAHELQLAGGTLDDWRSPALHTGPAVEATREDADGRRPALTMLADLIAVWELNPRRCVSVEDDDADVQAGVAAAMRSLPFSGGDLLAFLVGEGVF